MSFDRYKDLQDLKEKNFHRIDPSKYTIIFMDCKGITRQHQKYDLINKDRIYEVLTSCAYNIASKYNISCTIYGAIDEVNIIFKNPALLCSIFDVGNCADYILSLYMQQFLKLFWRQYPDINLKATIFNLSPSDIDRYIAFRKEVCRIVALFYIAKNNLDKAKYTGLPFEEGPVSELLEKEGLYSAVISNNKFFNGILAHHQPFSFKMFS